VIEAMVNGYGTGIVDFNDSYAGGSNEIQDRKSRYSYVLEAAEAALA